MKSLAQIRHLNLYDYSHYRDSGESTILLSALASQDLPNLSYFCCGQNATWFNNKEEGDDKAENNAVLMSDAIRRMTSLKCLNIQ